MKKKQAIRQQVYVDLATPHDRQSEIMDHPAKRKMVRAGRRGGKTVGASIIAVDALTRGHRVLYATPTADQHDRFWTEVLWSLRHVLEIGIYHKNETRHIIERPGTEVRLRAKTAWNADTLRGDYADLLILDEYQLMNEDAWEVVGAPMLLDNDGDAIFFYTPPSLHSAGVSKARDPLHAAKMFKRAKADTTGRWQVFHFTSHENPHISKEALEDITHDMSQSSYRQEIMAEDADETLIGLIYKAFKWDTCVVPRFEFPANWSVYVGHDFGGANPAAIFYTADPQSGDLYAFHEYFPGSGRSTAEHVEQFKSITEGRNVLRRAGGSHQEDEIRQGYAAHGWPISEPKIGNVKAGIDRMIGMHELDKVKVFEDLYRYLFEKTNYRWRLDENGQPTGDIEDQKKFHLMDAERYILSGFTPETVVASGRRRALKY
ncbi:hypothetical protein ACFLXE_04635 [Chloroflexota bacterium]